MKLTIRKKLTFSFLFLSIVPLLGVSLVALRQFEQSILQSVEEQLVIVRDIKKQQVINYFQETHENLKDFAANTRFSFSEDAEKALRLSSFSDMASQLSKGYFELKGNWDESGYYLQTWDQLQKEGIDKTF